MNIEQNSARKAKTHTVYKNAVGTRLPGVTTITGVMNKPALVPWANKLGLQGIEVAKYVDDLASIGTLAHYLISCHLTGKKPDTSDYSRNQIDQAETCIIKFMYWQEETGFKVERSEFPLISETYQYGGTIDVYGTLTKRNDTKILCDIKTAKGIYDDMFTQVAGGYGLLMDEAKLPYLETWIIRVGRDDTEGFEAKQCLNTDLHKRRFLICRELYSVNQKINK